MGVALDSVDLDVGFLNRHRQLIEEQEIVRLGEEDLLATSAAVHHVVPGTSEVDSRGAWHG